MSNSETTWFEARELKPYAEPVEATQLNKGDAYFRVQFVDENLLIPVVDPLIFIGKDLEPGDSGQFYFQDAGSYVHGLRYDSATDRDLGVFEAYPADGMKSIYAYERAVDVLLRCALHRRITRPEESQ